MPALEVALADALADRTPQARSLVASVFGDVVVPHGGAVWLGTLVRWLEPFGIAERNTRTAVTRLVNEGWLDRHMRGRRSELRLAETGAHRTREAEHRIYRAAPAVWKGTWSLVLLDGCGFATTDRDRVRRELRLLGFGQFSPGIFAHPGADLDELERVLREHGCGEGAIVLSAGAHPGWPSETDDRALAELVARSWDLGELSKRYAEFVDFISPILRALSRSPAPEPAFRARVLAVHEYRRIVLRDPQLPAELLPPDWKGTVAWEVLAHLYAASAEASTAWIRESGEASTGPFGASVAAFRRRFGGRES